MSRTKSVKNTEDLLTTVRVTKNGEHRFRERTGINKSGVSRNCRKAIEHGLRIAEAEGRLRKYLDRKFPDGCREIRVYNRYVYVFDSEYILITVWHLPNSLNPMADKQQKLKALRKSEESNQDGENSLASV